MVSGEVKKELEVSYLMLKFIRELLRLQVVESRKKQKETEYLEKKQKRLGLKKDLRH